MGSVDSLQSKRGPEATSSMASLCNSNEYRTESSVGSTVGASQLDLTNQYIPTKYSLDRYLEDFHGDVKHDSLMGYTWTSAAVVIANSRLDKGRYLEHIEKTIEYGFSDSKNREINTFVPNDRSAQLTVFPARKRISEGENVPWEVSTGRQTTQPRRSSKNAVSKQFFKRPKSLTQGIAISERTSNLPDVHSSNLASIPPALSDLQIGALFLPDEMLTSPLLSGALPSFSEMPQPSSSLVLGPSFTFNGVQFIQYYPLTPLDPLAGQEQSSMKSPCPSIEQIHRENTTPVLQCKDSSGADRHSPSYSMIDTIANSRHGTVSNYSGKNSSSVTSSSNHSTWLNLSSLLSSSSSEWDSPSPFASTSGYSMIASVDKCDSNKEIVSLSDQDENRRSEKSPTEGTEELHDGSAHVVIDWNEFLHFQNEE